MRHPLDSYAPPAEDDSPQGPPEDGGGLAWLRWLPLAVVSALTVMVIYQAIELGLLNRRVAQLYERMEQLDQNKMRDTSSALEAQQIMILRRLQELEATVRDLDVDRQAAREADNPPAALQAPSPPR